MSDIQTQFHLYRIREFRDHAAFETLYKKHQGALRRYLALKLPTPSEVDDAHSMTFLRLWNYLTSGTNVENLSGLIFTIGRGVVAEYYQKRHADDVSLDTVENEMSKEGSGKIVASAEVRLLKEALAKLPKDYQIVISLRHFEGLSMRQIAQRIHKSENATAVMLHRATKLLKEQYDR